MVGCRKKAQVKYTVSLLLLLRALGRPGRKTGPKHGALELEPLALSKPRLHSIKYGKGRPARFLPSQWSASARASQRRRVEVGPMSLYTHSTVADSNLNFLTVPGTAIF